MSGKETKRANILSIKCKKELKKMRIILHNTTTNKRIKQERATPKDLETFLQVAREINKEQDKEIIRVYAKI